MPVSELPKKFDIPSLEQEILQFWKKHQVYEKVTELLRDRPIFQFLDGPPYTTGAIHLGTAWNKIMKDLVLRYHRMRGFRVIDTPGFDMHGLPIEVHVEKELGVKSKLDIEKTIGVDKFIQRCQEFALLNLDTMTEQFQRLGVWMDWNRPYRTIDNPYIEGTWYLMKKAHERGFLYRGLRSIDCCVRCETAIAKREHEYHTIEDYSIWVKFPIVDRPNEFIVIWTTTPWTLPANMGVMVNPDFEYVRIRVDDEVWILAKGLANVILQALLDKSYEVLEVVKGSDLLGLRYKHPLAEEVPRQAEFHQENTKVHSIVPSDEYVTLEQGTGLVHMAPGHGPQDFEVGEREEIPIFCPVTLSGVFSKDGGKYAGMKVQEANEVILTDLRKKGLLVHQDTIEHEYAHCWRCGSPLVYLATDQWFLRVSDLRNEIIKKNEDVRWIPDWAGHTWFRNWVQNLRDWCISRQRYWGSPLPIWTCDKCDQIEVIGSADELAEKSGKVVENLHKPWIDEPTWSCPKCKGTMSRVRDVLDVWLESGSAPWATRWATYGTKDFDNWETAEFIIEGKDQVSSWFNTLFNSTMLVSDREPYRNVYMHGFTTDEHGRPMSKSKGVGVLPDEIVEKVGAETLRIYSIKSTSPGEDMHFLWKDVEDTRRSLSILWNVYVFATTFMKAANYDPKKHKFEPTRFQDEDRWILSQLNQLIEQVSERLDNYELPYVPRLMEDFIVRDLSRWYIKLIRPRTWISSKDKTKTAAFTTLYHVLRTLLRVLAPVLPFLTEKMYQTLVRSVEPDAPISVHMLSWPSSDSKLIDPELSQEMEWVSEIVETTQYIRQEEGIKLRWPCQRLIIVPSKKEFQLDHFSEVVANQTNVKTVDIQKSAKGKSLKEKELSFATLYLDISESPELRAERLSRDLIRQIQATRKREGLHVTQSIELYVASPSEDLRQAIKDMSEAISTKVGAIKLTINESIPEIAKAAKGKLKFNDLEISFTFIVQKE
ncbi:MAG: isoleucine--tRNA ligase [Candidatus Thorarchaeota archaeon]